MISDEEANKEIEKFHKQLLRNVIKVIRLHQKEVRKLPNTDKSFEIFNNGSIAFGDVLIHQIKQEIKSIGSDKEKSK